MFPSEVEGMVFLCTTTLLHYDRPLHHAQHYLGFTDDLDARTARHLTGFGGRLPAVFSELGISLTIARTWDGDRALERKLKRRKNGRKLCPICEKALDDGWLQVARLSLKEKNTTHSIVSKGGLDAGEAESIALASSRKLMVIIDDRAARSFAEIMGVAFLGTAGMLFHGFVRKHLTLVELEDAVEELSKTIWLAPAVVAEVLKKAREAER